MTAGSIDCWVFMCSLELIAALQHQLSRSRSNGHVAALKCDDDYSITPPASSTDNSTASLDARNKLLQLENAVLWNMARDKVVFDLLFVAYTV